MPKGILWKFTLVNSLVMILAMSITGWAIYQTACNLVGGLGSSTRGGHIQFNATLFQYFLIFTSLGILISSVIHYYLTKKLINPIRNLVKSTKILQEGKYPEPIPQQSSGEMEELINRYNELVDQLKRNEEERNKLIENISHELRTPTANMKGYLYALKEGDIEGDRELFTSLHYQAEQLTSLIEQIEQLQWLDRHEVADAYETEALSTKSLVKASLHLFEWQLQSEEITVHLDVEDQILYVHKNGMQQVLSNMIENALRYRINDSPIYIKGERKGSDYVFKIRGEGKEIKEADRERIFERFYRVEDSRSRDTGGSGLGLAIVKEIVKKHQGRIHLESEHNCHTFVVTLPILKE